METLPTTQTAYTKKFSTINLSNTTLTVNNLSLLERGLSFIPTRKNLPVKNLIDTKDKLVRRLKLYDFFKNKTPDNSNNSFDRLFTEKSTFIPPNDKLSQPVLNLVEKINQDTNLIIKKHKKHVIRAHTHNKHNTTVNYNLSSNTNHNNFNNENFAEVLKLREKNNLSKNE